MEALAYGNFSNPLATLQMQSVNKGTQVNLQMSMTGCTVHTVVPVSTVNAAGFIFNKSINNHVSTYEA